MKTARYIVLAFMVIAFVSGCGQKPTKEIEDTKAAANAVISEGLGKYSPEDEKKLNDAMTMAMDEIKIQEDKTFKNYDKAKQMLAEVKKNADEMKAALPAKKEQAKQNALSAQEAAKATVDDAKKLLAQAPKGKGTAADIEALRGDVKGIEELLPEVQGLIDKEEYRTAVTKAGAIKEKATGVANQIKEAMEKVQAEKATKARKPSKK